MSFIKVKGKENTFEWKIDNFTQKEYHNTPDFYIDGYACSIVTRHVRFSGSRDYLWQFPLCADDDSFFPVSYTISVIDREEKDFVTRKGKVGAGRQIERTLLFLDDSYIKTFDVIDRGIFSLRFVIVRNQDAQEESATDEKPSTLLETLSDDFRRFYDSKANTDCVLKTSDTHFPAHRSVLSARSSVFSAMFHHDTAENRSGEVFITDVESTYISDILYYVYSGKIRELTADNATAMYKVADKYALIELRNECLNFLKRSLTMDNICDAAILAHAHGETGLEVSVSRFIKDRYDELVKNETWNQLLSVKPAFVIKLLSSALLLAQMKE